MRKPLEKFFILVIRKGTSSKNLQIGLFEGECLNLFRSSISTCQNYRTPREKRFNGIALLLILLVYRLISQCKRTSATMTALAFFGVRS